MFCPPRLRQWGNSRFECSDEFCKRAPWQNSSLHSKLQDAKHHLESKREFPPYPSVASDGGAKTRRLTLAMAPKPYFKHIASPWQASEPAGWLTCLLKQRRFGGAKTQNSISSTPSIARSGVNPRLLWRWYLAPSCFGANQEITDSRGKRRGDFSTPLDFF